MARQKRYLCDHDLLRALARPLRARILAILAERVASPKEIAEETGERLSTVSYHVNVLLECGVVELDRTAQRRGALEHFYRLVPRELSWTPLILDERGVEEFEQLAREFLKSVLGVQARATRRLARRNGKGAAEGVSAAVLLATEDVR